MNTFQLEAYAQEGEDILLKRIVGNEKLFAGGFYVDVGALHPSRFSNTYLFYKLGWRGINIDATPGSMALFDELRPEDINIEHAVSDVEQELTYYLFNEPALNTFDTDLVREREQIAPYEVIDRKTIRTTSLKTILDQHLPEDMEIDYLTIDVEGFDFPVLKSNDWEHYRPKIVMVEILKQSIESFYTSEVYQFMKDQGYVYYAKTVGTHFFLREV